MQKKKKKICAHVSTCINLFSGKATLKWSDCLKSTSLNFF